MAAIPKHIQELITQVKVHTEQMVNVRSETDELRKKADSSAEATAEIRRDLAVINQKIEEHKKHLEKWDARWWYLIGGFVLGLFGLVGSLIVVLLRR